MMSECWEIFFYAWKVIRVVVVRSVDNLWSWDFVIRYCPESQNDRHCSKVVIYIRDHLELDAKMKTKKYIGKIYVMQLQKSYFFCDPKKKPVWWNKHWERVKTSFYLLFYFPKSNQIILPVSTADEYHDINLAFL